MTVTTVDSAEIEKFHAMAAEWWDPTGKFKPLHQFNPARLSYIRDQVCTHYRRDPKSMQPLEGLKLLDIGCGGGLLSEPCARMGAKVTGIDAGEKNVKIAQLHAEEQGLAIDYRHGTVEEMSGKFDIILNMEVIEHVADVEAFVQASAARLKKGGLMFVATLNRTPKSYIFAIVGAEYVLRWLPRGTHEWKKFLKPSEVNAYAEANGLTRKDLTGMIFNPLKQEWKRGRDVSVNYVMVFTQ